MSMTSQASDIHIRMAEVGDALVIADVLHASFVEYEPVYTPEAFAATTPTSDEIQHRLSDGPNWVALHHSVIVGTVSAVPRSGSLYIRSMAVLPAARGLGIGKLFFEQIERFAAEHGYQRLFLSTTPFLSRAIRLYEQMGFQRSQDGPHDLFGTPLFTMIKMLNCSV